MSDAAEYWHRQYEALKREHVALAEQTAALRYQIAQQDESIERLYEERNAWKTEAQEGRKQTAALRTALRDLVGSPTEIDDDRMRYVVMQVDRADVQNALDLLAAPEAAP